MKTCVAIVLTCVLALLPMGCKTNTMDRLVVSLSAVSAAAAVAIAVATSLEANEAIETETAAKIIAYSQAVSHATSKSIAELSFSEPDHEKILKITAYFSELPRVALSEGEPKAAAIVLVVCGEQINHYPARCGRA